MKISSEIINLPIICTDDAVEYGTIKAFLIQPDGRVQYLVIQDANWYSGAKLLPFDKILGIGMDAVTTESAENILEYNQEHRAHELVAAGIHVIGMKVYTKKGLFVGKVAEFYIEEDNGSIVGCQLDGENGVRIIPASSIVTYGKNVLIVEENVQETIVKSLTDQQEENTSKSNIIVQSKESVLTENPQGEAFTSYNASDGKASKLFEQRQRKFLTGRKASKRITSDDGTILIEDGQSITDALIDTIKISGKLIELTMNTKS